MSRRRLSDLFKNAEVSEPEVDLTQAEMELAVAAAILDGDLIGARKRLNLTETKLKALAKKAKNLLRDDSEIVQGELLRDNTMRLILLYGESKKIGDFNAAARAIEELNKLHNLYAVAQQGAKTQNADEFTELGESDLDQMLVAEVQKMVTLSAGRK